MESNKILRIILIISVVAIYSIVIYRWLGIGVDNVVIEEYADNALKIRSLDVVNSEREFEISQKNPFDLKQFRLKSKTLIKKSKKSETSVAVIKPTTFTVTFHGSIDNSGAKRFYLKINGKLKTFSVGQVINDVRLIRVQKNEATVNNHGSVEIISLDKKQIDFY